MGVNIFESVLRKYRREKLRQARKEEANKLKQKIKEKDEETLRRLREESNRIKAEESLKNAGNSEYKEKIQKVRIIKKVLKNYITGDLFTDIQSKMPRSDFARIRNKNAKVVRTNKLRNSLKTKRGTNSYSYELPEGQVPYAQTIDRKNKFITRGYWGRTGNYVGNQLYNKLKNLEKSLNITVEKKGKGW